MKYPNRIESWRPVPEWPGYEVSDFGRVRSIARMVPGRWGPEQRAGRILAQSKGGSTPYRHVQLCRDGKPTTLNVHRLVLEAFAGPRPPGQVTRHGPLGKAVNWWPENLCWGWQVDNLVADRERDGTAVRGEQIHGARLTAPVVAECRRRYAAGEAQTALAAEFGVGRDAIYRAVTGRTWRHVC